MSWNGAGTFVRLYSWVQDQANGILVRADRMDTDTNDIAAGITNCIARDGQAAPTADISWGSHKLTSLADGAAANDAVNHGQVFASPTFTTPSAAATPADGDSSTKLATTAFAMTMQSPAFRGTPTAPTAAPGTNTTQLATTAYVVAQAFSTALPAISGGVSDYVVTNNGTSGSWTNTLKSSVIRFKDGTDATKLMAFDCSGITTATTRTMTVPNKNITLAGVADVALVPLGTFTPTAAANFDALTIFTSAYDDYLIMLDGIKPSADDTLRLRVANAGTADAGSNYFGEIVPTATSITASATSMGFAGTVTTAGIGINVSMWVKNVNDATDLKSLHGLASYQTAATPGYGTSVPQYAYKAANAISGFRLFWNGGSNFAATGKVRVFGVLN